MTDVDPRDKEFIERLFSGSIYQNTHLGWIDLWQISGAGGSIRRFSRDKTEYLIALQPAADNIFWLHSFYCNIRPLDLNITEALKSFFPESSGSLYAISSHNWFESLLTKNGFRKCDEIIQMETDRIIRPGNRKDSTIRELSSELAEKIVSECETAFPPLWRMKSNEWKMAFESADYAWYIQDADTVSGYLFAETDEDSCHIQRLAVNPEHQHLGIASALISQMIRGCTAKGIRRFSVNTNKKNSAAVDFYHSLNFTQTGRVFPLYHRYI